MVQSREERLRKKREAERRKYQRLKESEEGRERLKEKERVQYKNKIKNKIIVPASKLSSRSLRLKRKEWRNKKREHKLRKKRLENQTQIENTPPTSDEEGVNNNATPEDALKESYKNKMALFRKRKSREIKKKDKMIEKLERKLTKYKKRLQREKKEKETKQSTPGQSPTTDPLPQSTPRTRVKILLGDESKKKELQRKLLFAEAVSDQLDMSYSLMENQKDKLMLRRAVSGKVIKKYKLLSFCKKRDRSYDGKQIAKSTRTNSEIHERDITLIAQGVKNDVHNFYLDDSSSRVMSGKKDTVTKSKVVMQKRYLNNTRKHLHREFLKENPQKRVSYSLFCRLKPFWVKEAKASDRETCKCIKCANIELILQSLHRLDILKTCRVEDVKRMICCNPTSEQCLFRTCKECLSLTTVYEIPQDCSLTKYYQWMNDKETYFDKKTKTEKETKKMTKKAILCEPKKLVEVFEQALLPYLRHEGIRLHQHKVLKDLKNNLNSNEAVIHMDFSENYAAKFSEEVQSFHFGGSRLQITLHTVVVYLMENEKKVNINFTTLSESLKHDVAAIWAHLTPVLKYLEDQYTFNILHFVSDSPSTQYRNKWMFWFIATQLKCLYPRLSSCTWNYLEAGHGKGAPDGIGGLCKRTADRIVAQGNDISNLEQLQQNLVKNIEGVKFYQVKESDIEAVAEKFIGQEDLINTVKGTMRVHQVLHKDSSTSILEFREVSHFDDKQHAKLARHNYQAPKDENTAGPSRKRIYEYVYSDDDDDVKTETPKQSFSAKDLRADDTYILVELQTNSKNKMSYRYVARSRQEIDEDGEIEVVFLKVSVDKDGSQRFIVNEKDISSVLFEQVKSILPKPSTVMKGKRQYLKFPTEVDVFEK